MNSLKAKKGLGNIVTGLFNQLVTIALGILIPRLILTSLGSEANGLLSSVNQVLAYLALLEAGIGTASMQALYGPVATGDRNAVNRIMAATHHFYRRTGFFYLLAVLVCAAVFPLTVRAEGIAPWQIALVVLFSGLPGAVNYLFQGKLRLLLLADGKKYVLTNLGTVTFVVTSLSKILLLHLGFGVVELQAMYCAVNLLQIGFVCLYMYRHYRWLDAKAQPDYAAISQSRNVVIHEVSKLIFNNTDTLILTWFCGLASVSVYAMYAMLFGMVTTLIGNFSNANFILGQTYHTDFPRFVKLLDVYEIFNMTLTFWLFTVAGLFITPFLRLYTADVTDIRYVDNYLPYLFIAVQFLINGRNSSLNTISFAQHFRQTQWRSVLESGINLSVSICAVLLLRGRTELSGIYGVLIGTIAALLYRSNDMILYANRRILHRSPLITYRRWLLNILLFIAMTVAGRWGLSHVALDSYGRIILWAAVTTLALLPVFFGAALLTERATARFVRANLHTLLHRNKS